METMGKRLLTAELDSSNCLVRLASKPCTVFLSNLFKNWTSIKYSLIAFDMKLLADQLRKQLLKEDFNDTIKISFLISLYVILSSRVYKRDHDVTLSPCHGQSFVVMCKPSWVHERPASASFCDLTVVTQKSASPALRTEQQRNTATSG